MVAIHSAAAVATPGQTTPAGSSSAQPSFTLVRPIRADMTPKRGVNATRIPQEGWGRSDEVSVRPAHCGCAGDPEVIRLRREPRQPWLQPLPAPYAAGAHPPSESLALALGSGMRSIQIMSFTYPFGVRACTDGCSVSLQDCNRCLFQTRSVTGSAAKILKVTLKICFAKM